MINIRYIRKEDRSFWFTLDKHLSEIEFAKKIRDKMGYGRMLMEFWEKEVKQFGYGMIMTSTQVDEDAQHFYRKTGFQDAGGLLIHIPKYEQPMEMFFIKEMS